MTYKYQIIIVGSAEFYVDNILNVFFNKMEDLSLPKDSIIVINEENIDLYTENSPAFVIYFGDKKGDYKNLDIIDKLIERSVAIMPIYFNESDFKKQIPDVLHGYNGFLYDEKSDIRLINFVLEGFGLLRQSRKLFISYKRDESSSIAIQLYEALEKCNFDVFLDTHSIKPGELFQEELWHRMADSDVLIMLDSRGFMSSNWCKGEINEANLKKIGILQLIWPDNHLNDEYGLCSQFKLKSNCFVDNSHENSCTSRLKSEFINELVMEVESIRARTLAARQDLLIKEFIASAHGMGKTMCVQPERFITESLSDDKLRVYIPAVGVPKSMDYDLNGKLVASNNVFKIDSVYIIYDDIRVRSYWIDHLEWLNKHLTVKTIKKQDFKLWLKNH